MKANKMATKTKVKIYSTKWCAHCIQAKRFFDENKVKYENIDVEKNAKAREEMIKKSGQMGVPVIDINGTIITGFDRGAIKAALKL